ncbi:Mu transposase C-terminal domain-containing protein [Hymenobacter sediminicola]|uniref:DDE-type integrase/transposase/recombinase n=1 Tax=Hymenobacter sediminicola TaxID=2761579 RepID=A0A7G7W8T8_9BACT|nr:Mu transposase C-terminal domain-containing protein [Hymenobacter sediminicola]QNH62781.1 DDE-type integrase/transposase/recombinase [Hymenobacter sediminicola]
MNEFPIQPGDRVTYQGKPHQIRQLTGNMNTVVLEDPISGRLLTVPVRYLRSPAPEAEAGTVPVVPLELVSDEQWAEAKRRLAIIEPLLNRRGDGKLVHTVAQQHQLGAATLYRWMNQFEATGQVSQLIPRGSSGGEGKSRLSPELEAIVRSSVEEIYLNKQQYPLKRVYRDVTARCQRLGLTAPHLNTVSNRVKAIREEKKIRLRHGHKAADDQFRPHPDKYPGADFPLAVVQIDHTPGDVILVDDETRMPLGRPWITMAIDVYSRIVVGFYVSFETPGALGVGMCVANSLLPKDSWLDRLNVLGEWPCWGKMRKIYVDNGKEFRGNMLMRACEEYGIDLEWRPVRKPNYGGHIERLLGTFSREIHELPGTTFSNPQQRGEYPSADKAALTLKEFERWLLHLVVNIYHKRTHSALGQSPLKAFVDGIYEKTGLPPLLQDEERVKRDFLPYYKRTVQYYGVVLDHIHYYSDVLRPWVHAREEESPKNRRKRKFIFKRDPRDISILYFYDPEAKCYFDVPYRELKRPPMTLWEHKQVMRQLESKGVTEVDEPTFFAEYDQLREIEAQAVNQTRLVRRQRRQAKAKSSLSKSVRQETISAVPAPDGLTPSGQIRGASALAQVPLPSTGTIQPFDELEYGAFD